MLRFETSKLNSLLEGDNLNRTETVSNDLLFNIYTSDLRSPIAREGSRDK